MRTLKLTTPLTEKAIADLRAGDKILLSGTVLMARDRAHIRLNDLLSKKKPLPISLDGQIMYYSGSSPAKPGEVIGAAGPTTAARMDTLTEPLLKAGLKITIGKGERSAEFQKMAQKYRAPYFAAMGGGGALMQEAIMKSEEVAFPELGNEAILRLTVKNMPLYVAYDIHGGSIYEV